MHYYTFNIGDHANRASHLSPTEDGILRRLFDIYLLDERLLALDLDTLMRRTRAGRQQTLEKLLAEFFVKTEQGWSNEWCDKLIVKYKEKKERNRQIAEERERRKKVLAEARLVNQTSTTGSPETHDWLTKPITNNQEPITNNHKPITSINNNTPLTPLAGGDCVVSSPDPKLEASENQKAQKKPERVRAKTPDRPPGVAEQVWSDFLAHRRRHRAALTETALRGIEREASIAGMSLEAALTECVVQGWRGFKAEWILALRAKLRNQEPVTRASDFDWTEGGLG